MNTQFQKGMTPWNKGLTKADPRVMKYVEKNTDRVTKLCEVCDKAFTVNRFRDSIARFCSVKCKSKWLGLKYINPNSFNRNAHNEYAALHQWLKRHFGKASKCEFCQVKGKRVYHWASREELYTKNREDWLELCPKCHYKYDWDRRVAKFAH